MLRVLITNDDGIESEGLYALVRAFASTYEVSVLAPSDDRSASSAALTVRRDLEARSAVPLVRLGAVAAYHLDATPATCVVLAARGALVARPDLVVSGVNPGPNLGSDTYLSGTVGAARVAATLGIPGVAVSCRRDPAGPPWDTAAGLALRAADLLRDESGGPGATDRSPLVNINVPSASPGAVRATTVARSHVIEPAVVKHVPEQGEPGRLLRLELRIQTPPSLEPGTDAFAFFSGDVSVSVLSHAGSRPAPPAGRDGLDLAKALARHLGGEALQPRGLR